MIKNIQKFTENSISQINAAIDKEKYSEAMDIGTNAMNKISDYRQKHSILWRLAKGDIWQDQLIEQANYAKLRYAVDELFSRFYSLYTLSSFTEWLELKEDYEEALTIIDLINDVLEDCPDWANTQYISDDPDSYTIETAVTKLNQVYILLMQAKSIDEIKNLFNKKIFLSGKTPQKIVKKYSHTKQQKRKNSAQCFNTALLNTDMDLSLLADRIVQSDVMQFSMCLYGAPGTGKSAYARYLADRMGIDVIMKRGSDLFSKWTGESEQAIAAAFREAEERGAMLVFDEADSFLQSRLNMSEPWQISQVNEMLTWMENVSIPFICTTNLISSLDKASLRRFIFKVKYDYLTPEQVKLAFKQFFGERPQVSLAHLTKMAPGDFSIVKRKADVLKITDQIELVTMLEQEMAAKDF